MEQEDRRTQQHEETYKNELDRLASQLTDTQWKFAQTAAGVALGLGGGLCLFYLDNTQTFASMGLILAVVLLLVIPNLLHNALTRSIQLARRVSLGVFALLLLMHAVWVFYRA